MKYDTFDEFLKDQRTSFDSLKKHYLDLKRPESFDEFLAERLKSKNNHVVGNIINSSMRWTNAWEGPFFWANVSITWKNYYIQHEAEILNNIDRFFELPNSLQEVKEKLQTQNNFQKELL